MAKKVAGSGQVRSPEAVGDPTSKKFAIPPELRVFHESISSSLQVFIRVLPCTIFSSQNLYICDLKSGQIRDLYITSLWENVEMRAALSKRVKTTEPPSSFRIMTDYLICDDPGVIY